jgi:arylsulfatase A-like enzyme
MIETLDRNVGRLMEKLTELGLEDQTIVFFMSDNGGLATAEGSPTSNLPLRAGKGWLYEGGIREPMFIRWPGSGTAGQVCSVPVTSTDFYPTMLEMAGLEARPKQHVDGISLVPLFRGDSLAPRALFWHYPHYSNQGGKPGAAIRFGDLKLIEFFEDQHVELYDLAADPGEKNNLADQLNGRRDELLRMLHRWQISTGAKGMDPNPGYDPGYVKTK